MADPEIEKGYNGFERFMFVMVPILFVIVLLGVLLTLFDVDFRNRALNLGQSIPVVKDMLPEPQVTGNSMDDDQIRTIKMTEKIEELEAQLAAAKQELADASSTKSTQESTVKELTEENAALKEQTEEKKLEDEEYQAKITELASMFTRMTPSKAAPIVQNMTTEEIVLLFSSMRAEDRVRIMEKMDPAIAAEVTLEMKDSASVKDQQIAALQARLDKAEKAAAAEKPVSSTLNQDQLSATFSTMDPKSAGEMLIKMIDISPSKVVRILNSVDDATRSSILAEMSGIDEDAAAGIMSELMSGS
ncbi:magnesium transporter MgtE N-terminal domain-containing protein [Paenibacillus soyae]|uniref:MgtE protein n=1 Tax=Paenibacillus soyae TaxID=2969249 RepID=A0A9X2SAV8_9BACL|nr:MgtE protein [Paenibacillus soyae]MCR2805013.1 MgtE protein [Paenibacillus soyae]